MRTTLNIDDELLQQARNLSGVQEKTVLVRDRRLRKVAEQLGRAFPERARRCSNR